MSSVQYLRQGIDVRAITQTLAAPARGAKVTYRKAGVPPKFPTFLPTVVDPSPAESAVLAEIAQAIDLHEQGDYWRAEKAYRRCIERYNSPRAKAMLAVLLDQKASNEKTLAMIAEGCTEDPTDCLIQGNWGGVLHELGRIEDAKEAYLQAVRSAPMYGQAFVGLGSCFSDLMRHQEAVYAYEQAVKAEPTNFHFWSDLIFTTDLSDAHAFADSLWVRRQLNDWLVKPNMPANPVYENDLDPDRVLRIGYASADMYQHSGATTWGGWMLNHDRRQVHITLYSATLHHDHMTKAFKKRADRWYDVQGWSDEQLAEQVKKDRIDILVDLAGYSRGGRVPTFATRPAPIQLSGWGYATSTGLDCMDYFATDRIVVPLHDEGQYVERPMILPSALSWVHPKDVLPVGPVRAALGDPVCFGVYNRQPKITRSFVRACVQILKRVPGSMLIMKNGRLGHDQVRNAVEKVFEDEGAPTVRINGQERMPIYLAGEGNHWDHLSAHWIPDIMLDPFPQGGGVSAFESLWMGVPLVTLTGDRPSGRIPTSLLHQVDLPDWATNDVETYVERAVEAAKDLERLKQLRGTLRERVEAMPACQVKAYARQVEAGYRERWQAWVRKQRGDGEQVA